MNRDGTDGVTFCQTDRELAPAGRISAAAQRPVRALSPDLPTGDGPPLMAEDRRLSGVSDTPPSLDFLDSAMARRNAEWLRGWTAGARMPLAGAIAGGASNGLLLILQAWLLASVIHQAAIEHAPRTALIPLFTALAIVLLLRAAVVWGTERASAAAAASAKADLRRALLARMLTLGPAWIDERHSGRLVAGLIEQVEALDGFFGRYLPALVLAGFLPLAIAVAIVPLDWIVALILLVTAPLIPLFMALVGWGAAAAGRRQFQALARMSVHFVDRLRGLATLKLLGRAEAVAADVAAVSEAYRHRTLSVLRIAFLSSAVLEFFASLAVAMVAVYVGLSFLGLLALCQEPLSLQVGLFCLLLAPEFYLPLRQLAAHYHDRANALAAAEELRGLLDGDLPAPDRASGERAPRCPVAPGEVRDALHLDVRNLTFAYDQGRRPVLAGVDLRLAPGEKVAIVGASGSGKSTLLDLLLGFREPASGEILFNGTPLRQLDPEIRSQYISWIGQRPHLFQGSIAENIRLAVPGAQDAAVRAAAAAAGVMEFAGQLPAGLDSMIGDQGFGLSGGQARRVAMARAFLRDAPLLLLDEPTAGLDTATAARLLQALERLVDGRSLIVVTHSRQAMTLADRVLELEAGRLRPLSVHG